MSADLSIAFIDRTTGRLCRETVFADRFLDWSYNSRLGWLFTRFIASRPIVSRLYGWTQRQPWSRRRIEPFVAHMGIDCDELAQPLSSFDNFAEFFTRRIKPTCRPIDPDPCACVSPVDGKILAFQQIAPAEVIEVKRHRFTLEQLLRDRATAERFSGGSLVIIRLTLADYHHFHFPDSGIPGETPIINGSLFAGGPYARRRWVPFYKENLRAMTMFDSDHFGRIGIIEVGAFTVGSVKQCFRARHHVAKGDPKGYFEIGGSTVVLLFEPGRMVLDPDLCRNSEAGIETAVRMGERIGHATGSSGADE
ncbi:MAG: phosphatidylserine decarboxylase [candidate division Zixibacteria bacterium]|nr:phosphatidylserine decarboxylase [candidate division Zixibacteria bacterium]